jgi:hypothetical protein
MITIKVNKIRFIGSGQACNGGAETNADGANIDSFIKLYPPMFPVKPVSSRLTGLDTKMHKIDQVASIEHHPAMTIYHHRNLVADSNHLMSQLVEQEGETDSSSVRHERLSPYVFL